MYKYINKYNLIFIILCQVISRICIAMTSFYAKDILDVVLKDLSLGVSNDLMGIFILAIFYLILDHIYIRVLNNMGLRFEEEFKRDSIYIEINSPVNGDSSKKFTDINEQANILKDFYIKPKIQIYANISATIALAFILSFVMAKEYVIFVLLVSLISSLVNIRLEATIRDRDQRVEKIRQEYNKNADDIIRGKANIEKKSKTYLEKYGQRAAARIVSNFIDLNRSIAYSKTLSKFFVFVMNGILVFYNVNLIRTDREDISSFIIALIYINVLYFDMRRLVGPILKVKHIKPFVDDLDFDMNIMVEDTQKKESVDSYEFVDVLAKSQDIELYLNVKFERGKKYLIIVENSLAESVITDLLTDRKSVV